MFVGGGGGGGAGAKAKGQRGRQGGEWSVFVLRVGGKRKRKR